MSHDHHDHHGHGHDDPGAQDPFASTAATYDDDAKASLNGDLAAAIAARVPLNPTWVALDFGAGTGLLSVRLASLVGEIDMVDTSTAMLEIAQQRISDHPNLHPVRRDLSTEPAPRDHYDLVTASLSLHHIPEVEGVLDLFARLLTPGGWIAIAELGKDPNGDFHRHAEDFSGHDGFDPATLGAALTQRGFSSVNDVQYGTIAKEVDGTPRDFPVHLIIGKAPDA